MDRKNRLPKIVISLLVLGTIICVTLGLLVSGLQSCGRLDIFINSECLYSLEHPETRKVLFSPDEKILATLSFDDTVRLWQFDRKLLLHTIIPQAQDAESIDFSSDGSLLAIATGGTIEFWNVHDGTLSNVLKVPGDIFTIAISPNNPILVEGGAQGSIHLWQFADEKLLRELEWDRDVRLHWVNHVVFNQDGDLVAAGLPDGTIRLWRVEDGVLLKTLRGSDNMVYNVAFSPDSKTLAAGIGRNVYLWKVDDGELQLILNGHTNSINSLAYSPDGEFLASGSLDGSIRLWSAMDGTLLRTLKLGGWYGNWVNSVAFSADGKILAVGQTYGSVKLFDVKQMLKQ